MVWQHTELVGVPAGAAMTWQHTEQVQISHKMAGLQETCRAWKGLKKEEMVKDIRPESAGGWVREGHPPEIGRMVGEGVGVTGGVG